MQLRALPRALVARYAPALLKQLLRGAWQQLQRYRHRNTTPRHLFVFGGRTHYWPGIGRELYVREPAFRATVQECERIITALGGPSLLANFEGPVDARFLDDEVRMLSLIVVIQLAMVDLWRAYGVLPDAVMGVSLGEVAAVYAASGLSREDALRVSMTWTCVSTLELPAFSVLVAEISPDQARALTVGCPAELYLISLLEPRLCLLLYTQAEAPIVKEYLKQQGVTHHQLRSTPLWPYHTARLARHAVPLRQMLQPLCPRPSTLPCYLTTRGKVDAPGTTLEAGYWLQPLQQPVLLLDTLQAALADNYQVFNPIGTYSLYSAKNMPPGVRLLPCMEQNAAEWDTFASVRQELDKLGLIRPIPPSQSGLAATTLSY
jgi:acyl transferase domain-containing protein